LVDIFETSMIFCDDFWLELIGGSESNATNYSNASHHQSNARMFDESTLIDMDHVTEIVSIINGYTDLHMNDQQELISNDSNNAQGLKTLKNRLVDEKRLKRYGHVFPCSLKREKKTSSSSSGEVDLAVKSCHQINLAICQLIVKSENLRRTLYKCVS